MSAVATPQAHPPDWGNLPIFPLGTVLFPGGSLPLKVFEARYVDMTRECMKAGTPFGVCLIKEGAEVGTPAVPHEIGCLATITDWDMQDLGVLHLKTRGSQRFRIRASHVEGNGLIRADTAPILDDPRTGVRTEFASCMILLKALMPKLPADLMPEPHDFDNAVWLSNRLSEVLPIPALAKQKLMELEDPDSRLEIIHKYLGQQGLK